jgi:hypothetical protein
VFDDLMFFDLDLLFPNLEKISHYEILDGIRGLDN